MEIQTELKALAENKAAQPYPVHEYAFIDVADIDFTQEVRDACEKNYCGCYGKYWSCPPGVGDWRDLMRHFKNYKKAFVYTTKHEIEDSFDFEGMMQGNALHAQTDGYFEKALGARDEKDYEITGAEGCRICKECTYPSAPCRFPDKMKRTLEACGVDVVSLSRKCGIRYNNGADTVTYFTVLFF